MKFVVDELPFYPEQCPFYKEGWSYDRWKCDCTITNEECNLFACSDECCGLKVLESEDK